MKYKILRINIAEDGKPMRPVMVNPDIICSSKAEIEQLRKDCMEEYRCKSVFFRYEELP